MSKRRQSNTTYNSPEDDPAQNSGDLAALSSASIQELVRDLQEQQRAIEQQNQQLQAKLAETRRWLLQSHKRTRFTLSRDLHGGPIQELSSLLFDLNILHQMLQDESSQEVVDTVKMNLKVAIRHLRQFIHELHPAALSHFGLQTAIRSCVESFQTEHEGVKVAVFINSEERLQSAEAEYGLYCILEQALENVAHHAQAQNVLIRLICQPDVVRLDIEDDGVGFEVAQNWGEFAKQDCLGLFLAAEHAKLLGGSLTVQSSPGQGTRVSAAIPVASSQ